MDRLATRRRMQNGNVVRVSVLAAVGFLASIVAANWATQRWGLVWGLVAPVTAGTYFAAMPFTFRDVLHETVGRVGVIALIFVGGFLSWFVAPAFAVPSAVAFLVSETADLAVYEPLRRRQWEAAVMVSCLVGAAIDTWLFLTLADLPAGAKAVAAQVVTKLAITAALLALLELRRKEVAPA